MKNLNSKIVFLAIFFGLFIFAQQAKAEETATIQLKVVASGQVLFDDNFSVNSCPDQASSTSYTLNAWCAVDQLVLSQGWTATSTWYPYGIMLNSINQYEGTASDYWLWFSNFEPGETALNQHIISSGEKLLLSFGTGLLKITSSTTSPYINTTTTLNTLYFDASTWQWQGATDSIFSINGQETSSPSGIYELWPSTTTAYRVFAKSVGFIDSEPIEINPQLVPIESSPLRITTPTTTPALNSTTTLYLEEFTYDASWNPVWQVASSSTFLVNGQEFYSADGTIELLITTTSPYSVFGRKSGYLDSLVLTLIATLQEAPSQPAPIGSSGGGSNNSGGGSGNVQTHNNIDVEKAINFLLSNQNSDGSIGSSIIYSDWAAIALSAFGNSDASNKLKNYLLGAAYDTNGSITDIERRAMALMALSVNPYSGTPTNYIAKIVSSFDGTQIGDSSLFNDDIFSVFPLLKAGYSGSDPIIKAIVKFIISKQNTNGSWGSVDLTAGAVQALSLAKKSGNLDVDVASLVGQSLQLAKNFLKNSQGANGGFSNNVISTSWAVQAIVALDEQVSDWEKNGNNSFDFLASRQNSDGGFEDASVALDTRVWTTTYVIPSALGKTWGEILRSFKKDVQNNGIGSLSSLFVATSTSITSIATSSTTITPTSTLDLASSTIIISTTSLDFTTTSIDEDILEVVQKIPITTTKNLPQVVVNVSEVNNETSQDLPESEPAQENNQNNLTAQISNSAGPGHIIFYVSAGVSFLLGAYLVIKFLFFKPKK